MFETTRKILLAVAFVAATGPANAAELGDPTRPSHISGDRSKTAAPAPGWTVESIIVSPGRRLAVINNKVVGINDWIGGARVIEILPYEVRLEYKGETRHVSLIPTRVKTPATEW